MSNHQMTMENDPVARTTRTRTLNNRLQTFQLVRTLRGVACALVLFFLISATVQAQQPFVTDDADVTPRESAGWGSAGNFGGLLKRTFFKRLIVSTQNVRVSSAPFFGPRKFALQSMIFIA